MMWLYIPFILQALCITFDEFYFHHKRGLPKWERIGHPLDTLSWLVCLGITLFLPFEYVNTYIGFGILSCVLVTKDEFVHTEHCEGSENWLHALLFILHPITLVAGALLWKNGDFNFLLMQTLAVGLFFVYQVIYWNFIYDQQHVL